MDLTSLLLIALGLSMDAFAVSVTNGITIRRQKVNHALRIGLFFGSFQALMPLIGWLAGLSLREFIGGIDHWIVFGLLSLIGGKMIYESIKIGSDEKTSDSLSLFVLFMLSVATSIDALAVGLSFALLKISIVIPILIIGFVTFILCFAGVFIGNKVGHFFEKRIEILGGLILIGIGVKTLLEHLA